MEAYFIANIKVTDRKRFREYQKGILATIKPFSGWILAAKPGNVLEGELLTNQNVIIRFPTTNHVRQWWDSTAYKETIPVHIENTEGAALAYALAGLDVDASERFPKRFCTSPG